MPLERGSEAALGMQAFDGTSGLLYADLHSQVGVAAFM